jgi:insulysin
MDKESASLLKKDSHQSQSVLGCKLASLTIILILIIAGFFASSHSKALASAIDIPEIDTKIYKLFTLENGLEVLAIQKKDADISAVSLSVGIGSNADTVPGIAHFLEHMLFFASEAYPDEDYFRTFIQSHNGYTNAYTDKEETNFFFTINSDSLKGALDIFSHAFTDPILLEDAVLREVNAVNSEHQKNLFSDGWRRFRLLEIASDPNHPLHNFATGSSSTLNVDNIVDKVREFFKKYYRAGTMKLVILGKEDTNTLQEWAMNHFSNIPQGGKKNLNYPKIAYPNTQTAYFTPQIAQGNNISIIWPIPSQIDLVDSQPGNFIAYLLNNPGEGGLSASLQDWVLTLHAEMVIDLSDVSLLGIDIEVTDEGLKNWKSVLDYIYGYIQLIENTSEDRLQRLWQDYAEILKIQFETKPEESADAIVSSIARNMQMYKENRYVAGIDIISDINIKQLRSTLPNTKPENAIYIISSSNFQEGYDLNGLELTFPLLEPNYDMGYQLETISDISPTGHKSFKLIAENPYIPDNLTLKKCENCSSKAQPIENSSKLELWYKFDTSFKQPKTFITLLFNVPSADFNRAMLELHSLIAQKSIDEKLYLFSLAGNKVELKVDTRGILVSIQAWSDTVDSYLESILNILSSPDLSKYSSSYLLLSNNFSSYNSNQPYFIALENLKRLIIQGYTHINERLEELKVITPESYKHFLKHLFEQGKAFMYADGNLLHEDAIDLGIYVKDKFKLENNGKVYNPVMAKVNGNLVYVSNEGLSNYAILNWYSFGQFDMKTWAALNALGRMADSYAFSVLRSQEQLGYIVFTKIMDDLGTMGMLLIVQGSYKNPAEMNSIIERFWANFVIDELSEVSSQIAAQLLWPAQSLEESHEDNWIEIVKNRKDMEFKNKLAEEMLKVSQKDVMDLLTQIRATDSELSVQVYMQSSEVPKESIDLNYFRQIGAYDKGF